MAKAKGLHAPSSVTLQYQLIRTTTSPDEIQSGVKSFVANLPAFEILKLNTKENLRAYIADYNPKKRNSVHDAIRATILQEPERFSSFSLPVLPDSTDGVLLTRNRTDLIGSHRQNTMTLEQFAQDFLFPCPFRSDDQAPW